MAQPTVLPPPVRGEWLPMSWEEFLAWSSGEGKFEWVDGKGIAHVSNSIPHDRIVVFLAGLLGLYLRVFDLGEVFVEQVLLRLPSRPSGRMPDLFVVGRDDRDGIRYQWVEGPILLAIEVLAEESVERDTREKRDEYERDGVREYLTVDARPSHREFMWLRLDDAGRYQPIQPDAAGRYHSVALPGFWLDPAWFDQDLPPNVERLMLRIAPEAYRRYLEQVLAEEAE